MGLREPSRSGAGRRVAAGALLPPYSCNLWRIPLQLKATAAAFYVEAVSVLQAEGKPAESVFVTNVSGIHGADDQTFPRLFTTFPPLLLPFFGFSLPFLDLSLSFLDFSLTFHGHSLPFLDLLAASPQAAGSPSGASATCSRTPCGCRASPPRRPSGSGPRLRTHSYAARLCWSATTRLPHASPGPATAPAVAAAIGRWWGGSGIAGPLHCSSAVRTAVQDARGLR